MIKVLQLGFLFVALFLEVKGDDDCWMEEMLVLVNKRRDKEPNLEPLCLNKQLIKAAEVHGKDLVENWKIFENKKRQCPNIDEVTMHIGSDCSTVVDRVQKQGYKGSAAENVSEGQDSVKKAVNGFIGSKTHLENMIFSEYTYFGAARIKNKDKGDKYQWVQVFGKHSRKRNESCDTPKAKCQKKMPTPKQPKKEMPTPKQPKKEMPTPKQPKKEMPTPKQPKKEMPTPKQPKKEMPTPKQPKKEMPAPKQPKKEMPKDKKTKPKKPKKEMPKDKKTKVTKPAKTKMPKATKPPQPKDMDCDGRLFEAIFHAPNSNSKHAGVSGRFQGKYIKSNKAYLKLKIKFGQWLPKGVDLDIGDELEWSINTMWKDASSSHGWDDKCSPKMVGKHFDPTFACGPHSEHVIDPASNEPYCKDEDGDIPVDEYDCDGLEIRQNCEYGDMSGKLGSLIVYENAKGFPYAEFEGVDYFFPKKKWALEKYMDDASWSIVLSKGGEPILCAQLKVNCKNTLE